MLFFYIYHCVLFISLVQSLCPYLQPCFIKIKTKNKLRKIEGGKKKSKRKCRAISSFNLRRKATMYSLEDKCAPIITIVTSLHVNTMPPLPQDISIQPLALFKISISHFDFLFVLLIPFLLFFLFLLCPPLFLIFTIMSFSFHLYNQCPFIYNLIISKLKQKTKSRRRGKKSKNRKKKQKR